jgi:probable HAF family extracellular repeat protein
LPKGKAFLFIFLIVFLSTKLLTSYQFFIMYNPENIDTNSLLGDDLVGDLLTKGISPDGDRDNGLLLGNKSLDDSAFKDPLSQELKPLEVYHPDRDSSLHSNDKLKSNPEIFETRDSFYHQNHEVKSNRNGERAIEPNVAKNLIVDPITGNSSDRSLVNDDSTKTLKSDYAPRTDEVNRMAGVPRQASPVARSATAVLKGQFGDFDGKNDETYSLKDSKGNIIESFVLTGSGKGQVWVDDGYEYVEFSGTDKTTSVTISAENNLKFDNYTGSTLKVDTTGSITAGTIALQNTNASTVPGLSLKAGLPGGTKGVNSYRITDLGILSGMTYSRAWDINNNGDVVGSSGSNYYNGNGFLYSNGTTTDIGSVIPNAPLGINDSRQIVANSYAGPFIYSNGQKTLLEIDQNVVYYDEPTLDSNGNSVHHPLKDRWSVAHRINNAGKVNGISERLVDRVALPDETYNWFFDFVYNSNNKSIIDFDAVEQRYGLLTGFNNSDAFAGVSRQTEKAAIANSSGALTELGFSGSPHSINDKGEIAGGRYYNATSNTHDAFLYRNNQVTDLGVLPGSIESSANDLNASGVVVGDSGTDIYYNDTQRRGFVYDGRMKDLNHLIPLNPSLVPVAPDWVIDQAIAINDKGQIVGTGKIGGQRHAYLMNPIPSGTGNEITVGTISTMGDSVLLQGGKINLTGSQLVARGGSVTLDGVTAIDSNNSSKNFLFDSTSTTKTGNFLFKGTVDGKTAKTQNLILNANPGNIKFEQAIGGIAPLKSFTVKDAKTFIAKDITTDGGDLKLSVRDDINTGNLTANGTGVGAVNISLGKIGTQLYDSTGKVTTGKIAAKQVDVLSDGGFAAKDNITTREGDVNIMALKGISVTGVTTVKGGTSLTSGTGGITATGDLISDLGFSALAKGSIATNKIESKQDVVILSSSAGAVTVNGLINAKSDVSLAAPLSITSLGITSTDGSVALVSATSTVNANGAIAAVDDITLGGVKNVTFQKIATSLGGVNIVSTEGVIANNSSISAAFDVILSAAGYIKVGNIGSQGGLVALDSGGTTTAGLVTTNGGDAYLDAGESINVKNIVSLGGNITAVSEIGSVTTGYLRSDSAIAGKGGKIYLQAAQQIKVVGAVAIGGVNYSIYTGVNQAGFLGIAYETTVALKDEEKKTNFKVGNPTALNGTSAGVFGGSSVISFVVPAPPLRPKDVEILIEFFNNLIKPDAPSQVPTHVDTINPVTNEPYKTTQERELAEKLSRAQKYKIRILLDYDRVTKEEVFQKGMVDTSHGCFKLELDRHLGDKAQEKDVIVTIHNKYASYVTGSPGDFLVMNKTGIFAFYDGLVRSGGAIYKAGLETADNSMAEVKTGPSYGVMLRKYLPKTHPDYLNTPLTGPEKDLYQDLNNQLWREIKVADDCHLNFFVSFSNSEAARAAKEIYENRILNAHKTPRAIKVYHLPIPPNLP